MLHLHLEHLPVLQQLNSLIDIFPNKMFPLSGESEEFRTKLNQLDKFHSKSFKQKKSEIKQKKTDLKKIEKKLRTKG